MTYGTVLEPHLNTLRRQDINILIHLIKYNTHITVVHTELFGELQVSLHE